MPEKIVQLNEEVIKGQLKELVRGSVEETLNELLEAEANKLTQAARYERNEQRQGYRSGHYNRNLTTTSGDITLKVPKLKGISFETAIIERYRRRESSAGEALIEMYWLAYPSSTWRECYRGTMRKQSVTMQPHSYPTWFGEVAAGATRPDRPPARRPPHPTHKKKRPPGRPANGCSTHRRWL